MSNLHALSGDVWCWEPSGRNRISVATIRTLSSALPRGPVSLCFVLGSPTFICIPVSANGPKSFS